MKTFLTIIVCLVILTGCAFASGKFSVEEGRAMVSVPLDWSKFDWSKSQKKESSKPLIYNQEALTQQLKGKTKEEVVRALGNKSCPSVI